MPLSVSKLEKPFVETDSVTWNQVLRSLSTLGLVCERFCSEKSGGEVGAGALTLDTWTVRGSSGDGHRFLGCNWTELGLGWAGDAGQTGWMDGMYALDHEQRQRQQACQ